MYGIKYLLSENDNQNKYQLSKALILIEYIECGLRIKKVMTRMLSSETSLQTKVQLFKVMPFRQRCYLFWVVENIIDLFRGNIQLRHFVKSLILFLPLLT